MVFFSQYYDSNIALFSVALYIIIVLSTLQYQKLLLFSLLYFCIIFLNCKSMISFSIYLYFMITLPSIYSFSFSISKYREIDQYINCDFWKSEYTTSRAINTLFTGSNRGKPNTAIILFEKRPFYREPKIIVHFGWTHFIFAYCIALYENMCAMCSCYTYLLLVSQNLYFSKNVYIRKL